MDIKRDEPKAYEPTVLLKEVKPGDVVRFDHDSLQDALTCDLFWLRVDAPEAAKGRVRLVNARDGKQVERDEDRRVIIHKATLYVL